MATRTVSAAGGNFNATGTWVGGVVPIANDDIIANATSGNLTLTATPPNLTGANFTGYTGTFAMATFNLSSSGTVTLGSGMTLTGTVGSARIQPLTGGALTIVSNGIKIPGIGTQGSSTVTFSGTASVGMFYNTGVMTGANVIFYGPTFPSLTIVLNSPHTMYIKPDTSVTFANSTALMNICPRVIFDTTNVVNTAGPILISGSKPTTSIGFLQIPAFNLGTLTQSAIVYEVANGSNQHTIDFGSTNFKLDRLVVKTFNVGESTNIFSILGTASFGSVNVVPTFNGTPGLSPSTTAFVAQRDVTMDELIVASQYSTATTQAAVALNSVMRNTVGFSAGVTFSISSLNVSGVSVTNGKTTISSMTSSVPATLNIGATYSFDNANITDIDNVGATDYAFAFSNNTLTRVTGITSSFPSSGGGAGGSFTFVS